MREDRRGTGVEWLAWLAVLLVAAVLLAATGFRGRDPDSALHAHTAARLAERPLQRWIAPEWWGGMSSFLGYYFGTQLGRAAISRGDWAVVQKLYSAGWYLARLVWFPLPASLAAARAAWSERRAVRRLLARPGEPRDRQALAFAVTVAAAYLVLSSVSDRVADRYIFPACWLPGAAGLVALMRVWPALRRRVDALDALHPVFAAALWLGLFALSLAAATLTAPRPRLGPAR